MFANVNLAVLSAAQKVQLLVLDVDGVLTTGQLFMGGEEVLKAFHTLDGHGIKMLHNTGVQTAIITARNDKAVEMRATQLGITHYFKGVHDKKQAFLSLCETAKMLPENCAMVGDDVIDLPIMIRCGLPIAVQNAYDLVKQRAAYITQKTGGFGAVREVCDLIMYSQNTLYPALNEYLQ